MIHVKVYAPAFVSHKAIDANGNLALAEGATLAELCAKLKLSILFYRILPVFINYEQKKPSTELKDGDIVSFLFPVAGG